MYHTHTHSHVLKNILHKSCNSTFITVKADRQQNKVSDVIFILHWLPLTAKRQQGYIRREATGQPVLTQLSAGRGHNEVQILAVK